MPLTLKSTVLGVAEVKRYQSSSGFDGSADRAAVTTGDWSMTFACSGRSFGSCLVINFGPAATAAASTTNLSFWQARSATKDKHPKRFIYSPRQNRCVESSPEAPVLSRNREQAH